MTQMQKLKVFFRNLAQHGCVSGMVGKLVWYTETHAFYDKYYDNIEELMVEYLENVGEALNVGDRDWKNTLIALPLVVWRSSILCKN